MAAAATAVCLVAGGGTANAQSEVAAVTADVPSQRAAEVRDYWTGARMRAAAPVERLLDEGQPIARRSGTSRPARATAVDSSGAPTAFPDRVHGKVFFTITGGTSPGDFVCSGTVVRSKRHSLVWTAGHCVNDADFGGGFATNWTFVPGYRDGGRPFGTWPARKLYTTEGWKRDADSRLDLGAARLVRDAQGRGIEDVIGARPIAFEQPRDQRINAFGYPALPGLLHPEFNGERLYRCDSPITGADNPPGNGPEPLEISCDMTGGSSGGGWVNAGGKVTSVTSYGYLGDPTHLYGPYLGSAAAGLHRQAGGRPVRCAGRGVTNLGGGGRDRFTGTAAKDTFRVAGARDRVKGRAGGDRACGGTGRDRLNGEGGNDRLLGGRGNDRLLGGPGFDICDGGPGRDRARGCERLRRIP